jgi:multiple sugar transport system permease protein
MKKEKNSWPAFIFIVLLGFFFTLPLLGAIYTSFKTDAAIATGPFAWEFDSEFSHYRNALGAAGYDFPKFFRNSVLISLGTVTLVTLIALPASYSIVRLGFGGPWLLRIAVALRVMPAIFFIIPFYKMFSTIYLIDTIWVMILVDSFVNITLALLIFSNSLADLPREIEEAAMVDGANVYVIVRKIVLPLMGPAMVAVAVLTFLFTWADYLFSVVLTASEATPVTVGAANFVTSYGVRWGDISATIVLSILPPLIFALFAQRYLVKGLSAGAVKG